ncbi:Heat shock 70 kDa protein [Capsicum chinense]|nr:Heat shock 70 kDa protein [Capsicum chinense]
MHWIAAVKQRGKQCNMLSALSWKLGGKVFINICNIRMASAVTITCGLDTSIDMVDHDCLREDLCTIVGVPMIAKSFSKISEGKSIGINLGMTYSCVGVWQNDCIEIIPNEQGNRKTLSYVAVTNTERLIDDLAKNQVAIDPQNTFFDAKRLIGRRYFNHSVQSDMRQWLFKVVAGQGDKPMIFVQYQGEEKQFSPEEISSMVLVKMKWGNLSWGVL